MRGVLWVVMACVAAYALDWVAGDPQGMPHPVQLEGFRHSLLAAARTACGLAPADRLVSVTAERERRIDRLAAHVRGALDMRLIQECLGGAR